MTSQLPQPPTSERAFGVLLALGLILGLAGGIAVGEPSAGAVIGLGAGALLALGLRLAGR
ncbi:hypothetical protein L6Q21_05180 [Sandaracinobacter sp. RS1-74]|uniref:hypothetical protein n=1 Tax=Sandaracinobacteroides sayramensis TaxID=2913411 RepID=UPI001EDB80A2|nr:hypothetical protein [Sandaracinobacteroides sayramensis]MCG2840371.1 hypothetical protein [Sandaracinobacteroides sayramensis]